MSDQPHLLRQYGKALKASPVIATVRMGNFIIDCANRLERLESERRELRAFIEGLASLSK